MNEIVALTYACEGIAKDIHYNANGPEFFAIHTLMDKVDFSDDRDELIEAFYLPDGIEVPSAVQFFSDAATTIKSHEGEERLSALVAMLTNIIYLIEERKRVARPCAGVHAILDSISQKALVAKGLILRTINGK